MDRGSETHAGLVPPYAKTLTTLIAGHALHGGQLLDEIGHDTGMSNDSGVADGTIGSRVALDEFEVDHQLAQERYSNRALFGGGVIAIPLGNRAEANREQLSRATRPNCEATPSP